MSSIRINSISVKNYRSFGIRQDFVFPNSEYKRPIAIIGYNNSGKTNLMNAIKYGLYESVREETFELKDFHNCDWNNAPCFALNFVADIEDDRIFSGQQYKNVAMVNVADSKIVSTLDYCSCYGDNTKWGKKWIIKQNAPIFYINFHSIKEEISTQKTSWGNLRSFLGKHIEKLVKSDTTMHEKKDVFEIEINDSSEKVLADSLLAKFIEVIQKNYSTNLRDNTCKVQFGLPEYEDIFLKMVFKIGLNGDSQNLIPIDHFGDGFISMFVMAVIQAIAESNTQDQCLFLFEEPESFLHENHQEYFYKTVLCGLAEKGHQVIYTTHSDKMIDPFDTKGLIRLEMDEHNQTVKKYNDVCEFNYEIIDEETGELIDYSRYNEFVKTIEPNLNRILFSKKVLLVEGPNDVLVYKHAIFKKVLSTIQTNDNILNKTKYADTFLNFENVSIVCHHGKSTALYLIELCKHFKIEYFAINDWDFEEIELDVSEVAVFDTLENLKASPLYISSTKKSMITNNWNLINNAGADKIHFNIEKLETVINYPNNDKSSLGIWNLLNSPQFIVSAALFPENLEIFLGINIPIQTTELAPNI